MLIVFPSTYPFSPPRVSCPVRLLHPNIDLQGHVCLNILRLDWSPVLSLQCILLGLWMVLQEPEAEEPLNHVAGNLLQSDEQEYMRMVAMTAMGGTFDNVEYDDITSVPSDFAWVREFSDS